MTRVVSAKEYAEFCARADVSDQRLLDAGYVSLPTPANDVSEIEKLLGLDFRDAEHSMLCASKECGRCGRASSWLDIIVSALRVHSTEFLKEQFDAKQFIVTDVVPRILCAGCGGPIQCKSYKCTKVNGTTYSCSS
jgi:hypothetical protein